MYRIYIKEGYGFSYLPEDVDTIRTGEKYVSCYIKAECIYTINKDIFAYSERIS